MGIIIFIIIYIWYGFVFKLGYYQNGIRLEFGTWPIFNVFNDSSFSDGIY